MTVHAIVQVGGLFSEGCSNYVNLGLKNAPACTASFVVGKWCLRVIASLPGATFEHSLLMLLCICRFTSEWNLVSVTHLLHVSRNTHLTLVLLFLLLRNICHNQTFLSIKESSIRGMLVILTLNRSTPWLDLTVAIGAHLGIIRSQLSKSWWLTGPLLRHHGVEVVASHRISCYSHTLRRWVLILRLLKKDLSGHVLNLDESCHPVVWMALGSVLLWLMLRLDEGEGLLLVR